MKRLTLLIALVLFGFVLKAQTVENIRVVQDGEQLKITYRIGASTQSQLYRVIMSCSMDGAMRFEPNNVMGDVGENIAGGKSIYTIMWDVFGDVDEVVNPNISVRVELMNPVAPVTRTTEKPAMEPAQEPEEEVVQQQPANEPVQEPQIHILEFARDRYFSYSGVSGFGIPIGVGFGSLGKWGYYVNPIRMCFNTYNYVDNFDLHVMFSAGATRNIVGTGLFRLHAYAGAGGHVANFNMMYEVQSSGHFMLATGVQGVVGGLYLSAGFEISVGYAYPVNFVYGIGFAF